MDRITAMSTAAQAAMTEARANGLEAFKKYAADLFQEWGRLRNRTPKTTATYTRNVRPFLEYLAAREGISFNEYMHRLIIENHNRMKGE